MVCDSLSANAAPLRLVVLGDSLSAGYMLPEKDAFPAALERALRASGVMVAVTNAGVSGDTASDGLERLDWSVGGADAVILELGANDMLRGVDPSITRKALDSILSKLKDRNIPTLIAGMYASPTMGRDYVAAFQAIYPDLAKKYDAPLYPFFLNGVTGAPDLQEPDGMHPNAHGVQVIVSSILPEVRSFLDTARASRPPGRGPG